MSISIGTSRSDWFTYNRYKLPNGEELPMAALKPEYEAQFLADSQSARTQQLTTNKLYEKPNLSAEQLAQLKDKYNPEDMSYDAYQTFLNDLVEMGIMAEQDKYAVGGTTNGLQRCFLMRSVAMTGYTETASLQSYEIPNNAKSVDITEWTKHRSAYDVFYFDQTGEEYIGKEKQLFKTISDVLAQMKDIYA